MGGKKGNLRRLAGEGEKIVGGVGGGRVYVFGGGGDLKKHGGRELGKGGKGKPFAV